LAGCATGAQQQYAAISSSARSIGAEGQACLAPILVSPEYSTIKAHYPFDARDISLAQLSDHSTATPQEIAAVMAVHPRARACLKIGLEGLAKTVPSVVPIFVQAAATADADLVLLIEHKLTWGELNKRRQQRYAENLAALQSEERRIMGGLQQQHQAEVASRQADVDAIGQWAAAAAVISAASAPSRLPAGAYQLPSPAMTTCNRLGTQINCLTQ
jgi:hypothetical protein